MLGRARLIALLAIVHLGACDSGELSTVPDPPDEPNRFKLDAGARQADASAPEDAGRREPDAGRTEPDAGELETCECPPLLPCEQPSTGRPFFSPGDGHFLGQLINLFACADRSIHLAMYETELPCVVDALIARLDANPDLEVSIVMDDDRCPRRTDGELDCELSRLEGRPRTAIVDDARSRFMHHKFAVADGAFLWTGSANLTRRSLCTDFNDALVIEQPEIVAAYEAEFDRMFTAREFGPRPAEPPRTGGPYSIYFGPESPISEPPSWHLAMIRAIETASTSIDLMVFSWTHDDLAQALIGAYGRGVIVRGVVSPGYIGDAPAQAAIAAGLPIRSAPVHSKAMIIDGLRVVTGTPNWSMNSWANDEASVWIDDPDIATEYAERFDVVWASSDPP